MSPTPQRLAITQDLASVDHMSSKGPCPIYSAVFGKKSKVEISSTTHLYARQYALCRSSVEDRVATLSNAFLLVIMPYAAWSWSYKADIRCLVKHPSLLGQ